MTIRSKIAQATGVVLLATGLVAFPGSRWASAASPADASAPATSGPQLGMLQLLHGDHGTVLSLPVTGTADVTSVTVTANTVGYPSTATTFTLSLASGTATAGVWQSTSPLGLAFDIYSFTATATDANAQQASGSVIPADISIQYGPSPTFHSGTFSPGTLSIDNPLLEAKGQITEYDPNSGDTGKPEAGVPVQLLGDPGSGGPLTVYTQADGSFDITDHPAENWGTVTSRTFTLTTANGTVIGPSATISKAPGIPTRIVLDHSSAANLPAGGIVTVSGTAQYQAADGTWHNFPNVFVPMMYGSQWEGATQADADGHFSMQARIPNTGETWTITAESTPWYANNWGTFSFTVDQQVHLAASAASVNAYNQLNFNLTASSTNGHFPSGRVYVQESADGKTSWKTLGYVALTKNVSNLHITGPAYNPHGYWRLYSPAAAGFASAVSNTIHAFRYATAIRGGRPNSTTIRNGHTLTFTGSLWQQGIGPWTTMRGATVALMYKPVGATKWYVVTTARTTSSGTFSLSTRDTRNATWTVVYITPDNRHIDAVGPQTYVRVH